MLLIFRTTAWPGTNRSWVSSYQDRKLLGVEANYASKVEELRWAI